MKSWLDGLRYAVNPVRWMQPLLCFDAFAHCYMVFDLDRDKATLLNDM